MRRTVCARVLAAAVLCSAHAPRAVADGITYTSVSRDALSFFRAGIDLWNNLYTESASEQFHKAVEIDPRFAMAYLYLARAALPESYTEYRENLDRAVALIGEVSEGERLVILAYQARDESRPVDEERHLRRLQAMFPEDVESHYALAEVAFANADYHEAVRQLEEAIVIDEEHPPAYNLLGYTYAHLGDYDSAIATLKAYASLIPDEPNPLDSLAEIYLMSGQYDASLEQYAQVLEIDPTFYSAHTGRGHCYLLQGKRDEAMAEYQKMLAVSPTDGVRRDARRWMAICEHAFGDHAAATSHLKALQGELTAVHEILAAGNRAMDLAWMYIHQGETDRALDELQNGWQAVMGSDLPEAAKVDYQRRHHVVNGVALATGGDVAGARVIAEKVRRIVEQSEDLDDWEDYNWLVGEILIVEEDYRRAIANLLHAPRENPRVMYLMGVAYAGRGHRAEAQKHFADVYAFNRPGLLYAMSRQAAEQAMN
jgi:tetratricopeptide (TPR) repeat protein